MRRRLKSALKQVGPWSIFAISKANLGAESAFVMMPHANEYRFDHYVRRRFASITSDAMQFQSELSARTWVAVIRDAYKGFNLYIVNRDSEWQLTVNKQGE